MPAMVDPDGPDGQPISLFESGAILIYLAEKHGKFLSDSPRTRYETLQWLMWQMGGLGPMLGQAHHFRNYAPERIEYAYDRYTNEANRLYRVSSEARRGGKECRSKCRSRWTRYTSKKNTKHERKAQ